MSSTTVMTIKTDKEVKAKAQKLAKNLGFALGTLINAFLRQFVRDKAVNFTMEGPPEPMTPKLERALGKIEADIRRGRNLSPTFHSMKEAIEYLHQHER